MVVRYLRMMENNAKTDMVLEECLVAHSLHKAQLTCIPVGKLGASSSHSFTMRTKPSSATIWPSIRRTFLINFIFGFFTDRRSKANRKRMKVCMMICSRSSKSRSLKSKLLSSTMTLTSLTAATWCSGRELTYKGNRYVVL